MRIGILTFHAAHNYGAVLQCYALQTYLQQCGHDVAVIDYRIPALLRVYKVFDWKRLVAYSPAKVWHNIRRECSLLTARRNRWDAFETFIGQRLNLTPISAIHDWPFDLILVGSDQVWNTKLTYGYSPYYWGTFDRPSQTVLASYAASMQDSWAASEDATIASHLSHFDALSVREATVARRLGDIMPGKQVAVVCDPTLLLSANQWDGIATAPSISEPYLFLYQVEPEARTLSIARTIATELGLRLVRLSARVEDANDAEVVASAPEQFVGLFKHASFVVCSSFHGTVFSLLYRRPFYSIRMNTGKDNRVLNLLNSVGLSHLFIDNYQAGQAAQLVSQQSLPHDLTAYLQPSHDFMHSLHIE